MALLPSARAVALLLSAVPAAAQTPTDVPLPRMVRVEGRAMRVLAIGADRRAPGQPVTVLESGAGDGLESWRPALAELARLGPVVAYDRRGLGQSEPDAELPTLRRVAQSLHALLVELALPPPYILVGQSWGGAFVTAFSDVYPSEVTGLVYLDVVDIETTREERAAVLPESDRREALAPPVLPPIPPDTPAGLRAEYEQLGKNMLSDYAEARSFRRPPTVPVAVIIAAPPGRLKPPGDALLRLQIARQSDWALRSSSGLVIVSSRTGHNVQRDDPALVAQAVRHVMGGKP